MLNNISIKHIILFAFILIASLVVGMMCWYTPYAGDDLAYLMPFREFKDGESPLTLQMITSALYEFYMSGARLTNLSTPVTLAIMPKWLMNIVSALFCFVALFYAVRLTKTSKISLKIFLVAMMMLLLPWHSEIFIGDVSLNYIWATPINLIFLTLFLENRKYKLIGYAALALLSFVAGSMHEGMALPLFFGLGIYYLPKLNKVSKAQWVMTVCYFLGICLIFSSPGIWERNSELGSRVLTLKHIIVTFTFYQPATTLLFITVVSSLFTRQGRMALCRLIKTEWIVYVLAMLAASAIQLHLAGSARCGWYPQVFSIIALVMYLDNLFTKETMAMHILSAFVGVVTIISLCYSVVWSKKMGDDAREITAQFISSNDGTVFYDFKTDDDLPFLALGKPLPLWIHTKLALEQFNDYYGTEHKRLSLVPESLRDADLSKAERIDGNANVMRIKSYLFVEANKVDIEKTDFVLTYTIFGKMKGNLILMPLIHSSGKKYIYMIPTTKRYQRSLATLLRID